MFINFLLGKIQRLLYPLYSRSFVLKNIDFLIFLSIISTIIGTGFLSSDNIGFMIVVTTLLTSIKIFTKPGEKFILSAGDKFLLIYFLFVLISVCGSSLLLLSLKGFFKTITYIGFYISVVHHIKDNRKNIKYILFAIAAVVAAESLIAFKQNFLSVGEISGWQDTSNLNPEQIMTRVYGSLKPYNPNLFGGYMLAAFPATLTLVYLPLIQRHYKSAFCGLLLSIASLLSIILTGCRGAYIALFIMLIFVGFSTYKLLKPLYKKIFAFITGLFTTLSFLLVMTISSLRARIFSIFAMRNDSSNSFRFNVYNSSIDMFKDNWLLGIGVGNQNFREIYGLYMKTGFDALSAYNIYLETAVESGIFALLAFIGFLFINLYRAIKYIFKKNNIVTIYLIIAATSIIGILVHGFVDTVFFRPQIQVIFWIMISIIRVLTTSGRKHINDKRAY